MSTVALGPLVHRRCGDSPKLYKLTKKPLTLSLNYTRCSLSNGVNSVCNFKPPRLVTLGATSSDATTVTETFESTDVIFTDTFPIKRVEKIEGKLITKLDKGDGDGNWQLTVGCTLPGKWILHWGVNYVDDTGSEWDQPPMDMRPPGSVPIKDYAIETPLKISSKEGDLENLQIVKIEFNSNSSIAAINFVIKDEETGAWYQHKGRDFKVSIIDCLPGNRETLGSKKGALGQLSSMILRSEVVESGGVESSNDLKGPKQRRPLESFYVEHLIVKEAFIDNLVKVSVSTCPETAKNLLYLETDIQGDVVVHWGVCKDEGKTWEVPAEPYPDNTTNFKNKALRTMLQNHPINYILVHLRGLYNTLFSKSIIIP